VIFPPLDLATTAAYLESKGISTRLLDANALHMRHKAVLNILCSEKPDFVGIPSAWGSLQDDLGLAAQIKTVSPKTKVVLSGPNVTIDPYQALATEAVDYVILGELELPFFDLVIGDTSFNLAYMENGSVISRERKFISDLDILPFALRASLPNHLYKAPFALKNPFTLMMTSRGCPYPCSFCQSKIWYENKLRFRSPENVLEEIDQVVSGLGIPEIIFRDLTITARRGHIYSICEGILRKGINFSWRCSSCVDTVDAELLRLMKRSGCHQISYGIESGSEEVLTLTRKGTTLKQAKDAVRLTKEAGIEVCCDFLLGLYGEDNHSLIRTLDFAKELDPDFAQFNIAVPIFTTEFYRQCFGKDTPPPSFGARWNMIALVNPAFSADSLIRAQRSHYINYYARPSVIKRQIARTIKYKNFAAMFRLTADLIRDF
jgi:anaerobic magnesium-protoporphyrin IX monomethyl ester cyclase